MTFFCRRRLKPSKTRRERTARAYRHCWPRQTFHSTLLLYTFHHHSTRETMSKGATELKCCRAFDIDDKRLKDMADETEPFPKSIRKPEVL